MSEPVDQDAQVLTLKEFVDACTAGAYVDDDGFGYYSDGKVQYPDEVVIPSDVLTRNNVRRYSHVVWFNR